MATVKSYNKVTNTTYVYESHKTWLKSEKKYKTVRKLIGKIDPETGKIVPTGPRGRPRREPREPNFEATTTKTPSTSIIDKALDDIRVLNTSMAVLRIENNLLISEREKISDLIDSIIQFAEQARKLLDQADNKTGN